MNALLWLFNIFTLLYLFRALQLLAQIWRERVSLTSEPLTGHKKYIGEQSAFFVAVPPGVLVHELGHALAIWFFGGRVVEFGYRVFWGYVVPEGAFTPVQDWFISAAGPLGNLFFGLALWLLLRGHSASAFRYFALRAFRFQVYFTLIYYPVFTLFLPIGDWVIIYNFAATPILSSVTAVFHLTILGVFWYGDRMGWFEMPAFDSIAAQAQFEALQDEARRNPQNPKLQLQYIDALRQGGVINKAHHLLHQYLKQNPGDAEAYLQLAALQSQKQIPPPPRAVKNAEKALHLGLSNEHSIIYAHQLIGRFHLERGNGREAAHHFSQAIAAATTRATADESSPAEQSHLSQLYYWRSLAYRRHNQYDLAFQDINQAIALAQQIGDDAWLSHLEEELGIIDKHAGRRRSSQPMGPF